MPIHAPAARLCAAFPLAFVSRARRRRRPGTGGVVLNLTSMIDLLTVVVIFLLMSFAASGEVTTPTHELPQAVHTVPLERAPVVSITSAAVTVDGPRGVHAVADVPTLLRDPGLEGDWRLESLVDDLVADRRAYELLWPDRPFPGAVVLQADRRTDFRVLKRVLYSVAQAGYPNTSLLVVKRPETQP